MTFEAVIGLEVHVQLSTQSKIFSGANTRYGALPNHQACAIDLGLPGTLPMLNTAAVDMAIRFGLATHCKIRQYSTFARKNYFYPDLPKGYQITQFDLPIVHDGYLDIRTDGVDKRITVVRAHLEEDAGKSLHENFQGFSGIDLNRAGTPLLEIVSAPELASSSEAVAYLKTLHTLVCYLGICDGNLQEGSFRCDANVSVKPKGSPILGTRCEVKNVNSFQNVKKAIEYEIQRQIELIESGGTVRQQTRLYDANLNETRALRDKEEANDYRYFPDPDLLPLLISDEEIEEIRASLPELPDQKLQRFQTKLQLSEYDAQVLASDKNLANFFEEALRHAAPAEAKLVANWVMGDLLGALNKASLALEQSPINPKQLGTLAARIADNTISGKIAKTIFEVMWTEGGEPDSIIESKGLKQVTNTDAISKVLEEVIAANPEQVAQYKEGNERVFAFLVGQVMKRSGGKLNPQEVNRLLKDKLS
ncbi:MAG: Asp-tRNA(Asn)/Glu-tRNA(Gln) amidotransferase subunit GatB [Pseudomonadota bacterium]